MGVREEKSAKNVKQLEEQIKNGQIIIFLVAHIT